jgi:hypothetical protein
MLGDSWETEPLPPCAPCKLPFRLLGVESTEKPHHELYTFECPGCGRLETRIVRGQ